MDPSRPTPVRAPSDPGGASLVELLIVVSILAIVAATLIPRSTAVHEHRKLEVSAQQVVFALRFARSEAMRMGDYYGVRLSSADNSIRVYYLNTAGPPIELFTVYHPLDKNAYIRVLDDRPFSAGVEISLSEFRFAGDPQPRESVAFAPTGDPVGPLNLGLMTQGDVKLSYGGRSVAISVAPATGRVTLP